MELEKQRLDIPAMNFDEVSMEHSKSFVMALQELKTLRPQLYSAAEYCEKSYLHSEEKEMVLDNLKEYVVRALVNAIDHLGTVSYKLTDLLEKQTMDVSTMELKVSCLNHEILTCKIGMDKEGLEQHQLSAIIPRHHKRYIFPNSVNKKVHFSPPTKTDPRQSHIEARTRLYPSASETKSTLKGTLRDLTSSENSKMCDGETSDVFHFSDAEEIIWPKSLAAHVRGPSGGHASFGVSQRDFLERNKQSKEFRSFEASTRPAIVRAPVRSKSIMSAFFGKPKTPKYVPLNPHPNKFKMPPSEPSPS